MFALLLIYIIGAVITLFIAAFITADYSDHNMMDEPYCQMIVARWFLSILVWPISLLIVIIWAIVLGIKVAFPKE